MDEFTTISTSWRHRELESLHKRLGKTDKDRAKERIKIKRKEAKILSISFWLDLRVKSLLKRLKNVKKRPLLNQDKLEDSINKIYSERKKIYNKSYFKIECNLMNTSQIVNKIIKLYENSENKI